MMVVYIVKESRKDLEQQLDQAKVEKSAQENKLNTVLRGLQEAFKKKVFCNAQFDYVL